MNLIPPLFFFCFCFLKTKYDTLFANLKLASSIRFYCDRLGDPNGTDMSDHLLLSFLKVSPLSARKRRQTIILSLYLRHSKISFVQLASSGAHHLRTLSPRLLFFFFFYSATQYRATKAKASIM